MYNEELPVMAKESNIDVFHTVHGRVIDVIRNLIAENKMLRQEIEALKEDVAAFDKEVNLTISGEHR